MSKSNKLNRKTKILPRADEDEDLQGPPKKVQRSASPLRFDVKIEVEECNEDFGSLEDDPLVIDENSLTIKDEVEEGNKVIEIKDGVNDDDNDAVHNQQAQNKEPNAENVEQEIDVEKNNKGDDKQEEDNDSIDDNTLVIDESDDKQQGNDEANNKGHEKQQTDEEETRKNNKQSRKVGEKFLVPEKNVKRNNLLRTLYDMSQKSAISVRQCKITAESVFGELEKLMSTELSIADKKLVIEVGNSWGRVSYIPHLKNNIDSEIQRVLEQWKLWYTASKIKAPPLLYICYYCKKGWWHLNDFRDHLIESHDDKELKCYITINMHECYVTAGTRTTNTSILDVESECWHCGGEFSFHKPPHHTIPGPFYFCTHCDHKFHVCKEFADHQGTCVQFRKYLKKSKREGTTLEFYRCFVCKMILTTKALLHHHFANFHTVRSDLPIANDVKTCNLCFMQYADKLFHSCPKKNYTITCTNCHRRFPSRVMLELHKKVNNGRYYCNVCDEDLQSKCMDVEHMIQHTDNFMLMYKCVTCDENIFLVDELSMKQHIVIWHKKFYDRRRKFVETVVIPTNCVNMDQVEQLNIVSSLSGKFEIFAKPNSSGVLEASQVAAIDLYNKPNKKNNVEDDFECKIIEDEVDIVIIDDEYNGGDESTHTDTNNANTTAATDAYTTIGTDNSATNISVNENSTVRDTDISPADNSSLNYSKLVEDAVSGITTTNDNITINMSDISFNENDTVDTTNISLNDNATVDTPNISVNEEHTSIIQSETNEVQTDMLNVKIKVEKEDEIHKTLEDEREIYDVTIKTESDSDAPAFTINTSNDAYANLLSKVFGGSYNVSLNEDDNEDNEQTEEDFEDDIIDLLANVKSEIDEGTDKTKYKCEQDVKPSTSKAKGLVKKKKKPYKSKTYFDSTDGYTCTKCDNTYQSIEDYGYHFALHGFDGTQCPICDMIYPQRYNFSMHIKMHIRHSFYKKQLLDNEGKAGGSVDLVYSCRECKENVDVEDLFSHWENHVDLERHSTFNTNFNEDDLKTNLEKDVLQMIKAKLLSKESRETRGESDRTCFICQHQAQRRNDHKRHLIEHLLSDALSQMGENRGLVCQICGETLSSSDKFREHMRDHGSLPVFRCVICSKSFSDSSNFSKHKKTHNFHMHECTICEKKFHGATQLQKHMEFHETNEPVKCTCCDKTYYDPAAYRKHMKKKDEIVRFRCQVCKEKFKTLRAKWDHLWQEHKMRKHKADCPLCAKPFRKLQDLKRHMSVEHRKKVTFLNNKRNLHVVKMTDEVIDDKEDEMMYVVFEDYFPRGGNNKDSDEVV